MLPPELKDWCSFSNPCISISLGSFSLKPELSLSAITSILGSNPPSLSSPSLFYLWVSLADFASVLGGGLCATAALTCGAAGARSLAVLTFIDPILSKLLAFGTLC